MSAFSADAKSPVDRQRGATRRQDELNELDELTEAVIEMAVRSAEAQGLSKYVIDAGALRSVAALLACAPKSAPP